MLKTQHDIFLESTDYVKVRVKFRKTVEETLR